MITFTLFSCTSLSDKGANVLLKDTKREVPQNCNFVKYVESVSSKSDFSSSLALAKIRLRNEAGELGADLVVVTKTAESSLLVGSVVIGGDAYNCAF